jgi:cytochrome c5
MRASLLVAVSAAFGIGVAVAQTNPERDADRAHAIQAPAEEESILPDGEGRSETFAYCTVCHSTAIIRRSRFGRAQWDGLMDWMAEKHGMNPLEGEFRDTIVNYLAQHFGPAQVPARGRNPFLN